MAVSSSHGGDFKVDKLIRVLFIFQHVPAIFHFSLILIIYEFPDLQVWVHRHELTPKDETVQRSGWTCHAVGSYK